MSNKLAPPPPIDPETMHRLLAATADLAANEPWKHMYDTDVVGLTDAVTGEIRLATVLGRGGEVFGAAIYRHAAGLRWLLNLMQLEGEPGPDTFEGMDAVKVELVAKHEMSKAELATLKALNFRPNGRGHVWPQFQSTEPGWMPWHINQAEAEQLLADLPRLMAFCQLLQQEYDVYGNHEMADVPFLPNPMPGRPLQLEDLEWRTLAVAPEPVTPFQATAEQLGKLGALPRIKEAVWEFGCALLLGSPVLENGRPCQSRISLLVEDQRGLILGADMGLGTTSFAESAGFGLVDILLKSGSLPGAIAVHPGRLEPALKPLCDALRIKLMPSISLPFLEEAMESLRKMSRGH